ncbi:MAG: nucleotidyltransferase family protein [Clostridia bacterium]|nr:nucleotidyltransferase family protein [Clostridia bacterium]
MKITGIVAEYNPFHNGHKALVDRCRENGATHIVAAMSGNFVQRGSVAIMDKRARAAAAIRGGVDLVLELPVPFAVATAEVFARGGISVLDSLGCVDALSFGAECDDLDLLKKAAAAVTDPKVDELIKTELSGGVSYPTARAYTVRSVYGADIADVREGPNNILAVEYLKELERRGSGMAVKPMERVGTGHDGLTVTDECASASMLRILLERGDERAFDFMPPTTEVEFKRMVGVGRAPVRVEESERAILSRLRMLTAEDIRKAPDVSEGLENRICNAIQSATSLEELYDIVKTKRYTHSRIRRIVTAIDLGILPEDREEVPYLRVLGFNDRGLEILKAAKETASLPIITKPAAIAGLDEKARHTFELECRATNLYNLATPRILPCGTEYTDEIVMF